MSGWSKILEAAQAPTLALVQALDDPAAAQTGLLLNLLHTNQGCQFGQQHQFSRIRDVADFRSAVPVRSHDAFRPYIERMAAGEAGVLTSEPVVAFEETGGTASGGKLIPYTARSLESFRCAVLPWLSDLARRRPGIVQGSAYVSISPATRPLRNTAGGLPIGLASDAAYLGMDLVEPFISILATPPEVAAIADIQEWRVATLAHLVEREDLSFVSVWSPTFWLDLVQALPTCVDEVAARISPAARQRLARAVAGPELLPLRLWPRLDTISCWTDGSSSSFARRLGHDFPRSHIDPKGLLATEAAITVPWGEGSGAIPALTSTFVEFIDDGDASWMAHELVQGQGYRVVITTSGGLYRYDMGDRVRCLATNNGLPRLAFEGRCALVSDMVGEKLDEAFVAKVLAMLPVSAALLPHPDLKPHYELWLDGSPPSVEEALQVVEAGLCANPQYAYARRMEQLGALCAKVRPGFVAQTTAARVGEGRRLGDLKHISILSR